MDVEFSDDWAVAFRITKDYGNGKHMKLTQVVLRREGLDIVKRVRNAFNSGGNPKWAPLSNATLLMRKAMGFKGSKILIRTADLRNSVALNEIAGSEFSLFVGVNRSAAHSGGTAAVNIAMVHEFGATINITVTRKMQRFLMAMLGKQAKAGRDHRGHFLKKGEKAKKVGGTGKFRLGAKLTIRIPARPFMGPEIKRYTDGNGPAQLKEKIEKYVAENMK